MHYNSADNNVSSGHEGGRSSTSCTLWTAGLLHFSSVHQSPGVTIPLTQIQSKYTSNKANSTAKHHYCLHLTKLRSNLTVKNTLQAKLDMLTLEVINSCTCEPQWSWASVFSGCKALRHILRTTLDIPDNVETISEPLCIGCSSSNSHKLCNISQLKLLPKDYERVTRDISYVGSMTESLPKCNTHSLRLSFSLPESAASILWILRHTSQPDSAHTSSVLTVLWLLTVGWAQHGSVH